MSLITRSDPAFSETADADRLKSRIMRRLIAASGSAPHLRGRSAPPRLLVQFWDDASTVPSDVQACFDTWAPLESAKFERLLFDDQSARRFIREHFTGRHSRAFDRCVHPAMRADYFRLCFILQVGGVYVDADDEYQGNENISLTDDGLLRLQALCYDIASDSMVDVARAVEEDADDGRIFYVNNNPLIAAPGHPVLASALERSTTLLLAAGDTDRDIQALTGPGNLTACLIEHAVRQEEAGDVRDFELVTNWDSIAVSKWPLAYRADGRNWRNWVRGDE